MERGGNPFAQLNTQAINFRSKIPVYDLFSCQVYKEASWYTQVATVF